MIWLHSVYDSNILFCDNKRKVQTAYKMAFCRKEHYMVEIQNLTKYYGNKAALKGISFTIKENEVLGFLGPNGAGKSTTLNIMAGVIPATGGSVKIQGYDIAQQPVKAKRCIGFLPEIPPVYPDMKVREYLNFAAGLKGIPAAKRKGEVERVMERLKITDVQKRLIRNLSKGYKQRVGFAMAILGDPPVLILDEPTVGLDPTQLMEVRNLILDLRRNHAIILSSHILGEISAVCDRIVIINHGEIKADDTIERLEEADDSGLVVKLKVQGSSREVPKVARSVDGVVRVDNIQFVQTGVYTYDVELENDGVRNALLSALLQHGLEVLEISTEKKNLEQVFVKLVNQKTKHSSLEDLLQEMDDEAAQEPAAQPAEDKPAADAPAEDAARTDGKKED